ncbi:MAG: tyrosine-type recombinase/integrase [Actinomycetaceae bacterium]|nr:tyrosine-type recombinase/integrase [Actinomycetaceae bacterium]
MYSGNVAVSKEAPLFGQLAEVWINTKIDIKPSTMAGYRSALKIVLARFETQPVTSIRHIEVATWMKELSDAGYSASHLRQIYNVAHGVLEFAVRDELVRRNAAAGVGLPRGAERAHHYLGYSQIEALAGCIGRFRLVPEGFAALPEWRGRFVCGTDGRPVVCRTKGASGYVVGRWEVGVGGVGAGAGYGAGWQGGYRRPAVRQRMDARVRKLSTLVRLLGYCGLRYGEAAALDASCLDVSRMRLAVRSSVTEVGGRQILGTPKNHQSRSVPVPSFLMEELVRLAGLGGLVGVGVGVGEGVGGVAGSMGDHGERSAALGNRKKYLFSSRNGTPLRASNIRKDFDIAACVIGIPSLHIHDLRHTAASLAVSSGAVVKAVQRMLGHKSAAMTLDVYSDLFDDDLDILRGRMEYGWSAWKESGEVLRGTGGIVVGGDGVDAGSEANGGL